MHRQVLLLASAQALFQTASVMVMADLTDGVAEWRARGLPLVEMAPENTARSRR